MSFDLTFNRTYTVGTVDRWLAYLVEQKATPLILIARTEDDAMVTCFDEQIRDMPFKGAMELLLGLEEGQEEDEI